MGSIRVTGKGQIKVKPDMTRITMTLEGTYEDYGEALHHSSLETEKLKDLLCAFGFVRSDLKTLNFGVDTEYESYKEQGVYKQRFKGYKYRHLLKIEFESDNERLGKILYALANCSVKPEFRISYTVKDPESAKNELLGKAISDACEKAAVLAKAAGVSVGEIESIDYSWGEVDFVVSPMNRALLAESALPMAAPSDGSYEMDIEPDDIEVADTVTVIWKIQ